MYFIFVSFRKRKAFLIHFWRASLPPVPIKTSDWLTLVKREQRSNITNDLPGCLFLIFFCDFACLHCFLYLQIIKKTFHLSLHLYSVYRSHFSTEKFKLRHLAIFYTVTVTGLVLISGLLG